MTNEISDEDLHTRFAELNPNVITTTAITPAIYVAEKVLEIAKEVCPGAGRCAGIADVT